MITIYVANAKCKIIGLSDEGVIKELDKVMSYTVQSYQFMRNSTGWDGRYRLFNKKTHTFPVGLLTLAKNVLKSKSFKYEVKDNRPIVTKTKSIDIDPNSIFVPRDYQIAAVNAATKAGSGILRAATGCHAAGQEILMFDGTIKLVEDVVVGDLVMGPDSTSRRVLKLCRGSDRMVKINPIKGDSFTINQEHILSLQRTNKTENNSLNGKTIDIKFSDWELKSKTYKHVHKLFRVPINFKPSGEITIEPYLLGLLLGDGSLNGQIGITTVDKTILNYIYKCADDYNLTIRKNGISYYFRGNKRKYQNKLRNQLRELNLLGCGSGDKYIPIIYKTSSRDNRLNILAGLMDSDGSLSRGGFDYISKSEQLSKDVAYIARSLGLAAYVSKCEKSIKSINFTGTYFRVGISGDCSIIPTKLLRKKAPERLQKKSVLRTGFNYEEAGRQNYYGFQVDGDNRYLMGDFTVTHNSGKSLIIAMIAGHYNVKSVIYVIGKELLYQMKDTLEAALGVEVGIVGDGLCNIVDGINICTIWSAAAAFNKKAKILDNDSKKGKKLKKEKNQIIRDLVRDSELFFVDECQYAAAETVQFLHRESISARHRFLLSGTPWREAGDDILIEAVGGPKFYDITATELIKKGWLVQPYITFIDVPTLRGVGNTYHEVYNNFIVNNDYRNSKIAESAKKMIDAGRKVLILVTKVDHGDIIREFLDPSIRVDSLNGSNSTKDRMNSISKMKNGELDLLIASSIFDQGIDIPQLDGLILAGSGKSTARALQRIGRVIRRKDGKDNAVVVDFYDNCKYLRDHSDSRHKIYSTEPGFKIRKI